MSREYLPDPIERGEASAERWADENINGGKFTCPLCGKLTEIDDAFPASPDPYAPPICGNCAYEEQEQRR